MSGSTWNDQQLATTGGYATVDRFQAIQNEREP